MNAEKVRELADFIERRTDLEFDQRMPEIPECNSAGCITGFAVMLWGSNESDLTFSNSLKRELALDVDRLCKLFNPQGSSMDTGITDNGYITRAQAVRTLRHLADTGEVRWDV